MLLVETNHKVGDAVYVVSDCVRRGIVQEVDFTETTSGFTLSYAVLYDGYTFTETVDSAVFYQLGGSPVDFNLGSPLGSPQGRSSGSPFGSPLPFAGSPHKFSLTAVEVPNGGGIYADKTAALTAFGKTLA